MAPSATATAHMATTTFKVEGMTCGACTSAIESGFQGVKGIGNVSISLVMERAVIQHDPEVITADEVKEIIEDRGFDAEVLSSDLPMSHSADDHFLSDSEDEEEETNRNISTTTIAVGGMTCGACTSAVEGAFKDVAGVTSFSISLLSERAVIEHDPTVISAEKLAETIEDVGFDAEVLDTVAATPATKKSKKSKQHKTLTTTVAIEGMTCGACTSAVEAGFKDVDGVYQFNISLLANRAVLVHDPSKLTDAQIVEIIEDRGFDAEVVSSVDSSIQQSSSSNAPVQLKIYGLPNSGAAQELEGLLKKRSGVTSATVNFNTSRATIQREPQIVGIRAIVETVEAAGYNALVADSEDNNAQLESLAKTKEIKEWRRAVIFSAWFAVPVFLTSMFIPMFMPRFLNFGAIRLIPGLFLGDVLCLVLTIPVQFGIGKRFYVSAYKSLSHGSPTMDVLVVLGTSAAFFFSVFSMIVSVLIPPHTKPTTLFDTSTMLFTFISLGRYLENSAKGRTSKALSNLMSLAPSSTTIYADPIAAAKAAEAWDVTEEKSDRKSVDGNAAEERVIPTELIETGDVVILRPGDKVPADGTVTRGESYLNESMVTGEAMPILKKKGSLVMAGTVNGNGRLEFVVTRAGRDTQLSQIVRLVQEAQTSRAPIQRVADTVAGYFVPIIITLGLATFVGWMVLSHVLPYPPKVFLDHASGGKFMVCFKLCIAVIVFACPCALGLATPTAVMVGTGVGAEQGILVKGGAALETATKINHVVFDKTGTLTIGQMSVSKTDIQGGWNNAEKKNLWWTLIGLAEMGSEHPIAKAIVLSAKEHLRLGPEDSLDGSVGDFEAVIGKGITATVEAAISRDRTRYKVLIGNVAFLTSQGVNVPDFVEEPLTPAPTANPRAGSQAHSAGTTTIHTAIGNTYTGTLSLSDTIKPSARACVLALSRLGIKSSIVTGDTSASAMVVAAAVGIDPADVHASCAPADKKAIVEDLQSRGGVIGMVGDGINDSPALASADIGIALSTGTDVAMEAASIVLMTNTDLLAIPASLVLSRAIFFRIKLNLAWACMYNFIGLPFAMGFFLPWGLSIHPMAAGAAMAASSVSVVFSSLHLKFWNRPSWMKVSLLDPSAPLDEKDREMENMGHKGVISFAREWISDAWAARKRNKEEASYMPLRDMGEH
ncbi:putative copper-transporting ATPase HMA5 [Curvularia clavata]|uniref:P-type Cu(+) transporter n=1 Tax=Curvularia clavata TaxID=95742 RepID=A0A9Q9DVA3_CURCL|nr:putative copper-transporting ATPase HMA5 [Curvularia clavata]